MNLVLDTVQGFLAARLPRGTAATVVKGLHCAPSTPVGGLDVVGLREVTAHVEAAFKTFAPKLGIAPVGELKALLTLGLPPPPTRERLVVANDADVLHAQRICQRLTRGAFGLSDSTRLVTAVSELARNIYMYAKTGEVTQTVSEEAGRFVFKVVASDRGPGIPNLDSILAGGYVSRTGLGRGLLGTKALLDTFDIQTRPGLGTTITGIKRTRTR
jgi:serine/threonine-protein kinase RsbT